ncbi:hypothetical protein Hanom_Chr16g01465031 [Helianthus anomalus]
MYCTLSGFVPNVSCGGIDSRKTRVHALFGFCPIAECYVPYVQGLMQNYYRVGVLLEVVSLFLRGRGKSVYILPYSDPILALLLVIFTEYDDYDDFVGFYSHCSSFSIDHRISSFKKKVVSHTNIIYFIGSGYNGR